MNNIAGISRWLAVAAVALIAVGCADSDKPGQAEQGKGNPLLHAAETVAAQITDTVARQTALSAIAVNYAELGAFSDAERVSNGLKTAEVQTYLLAKIATEQSRKGHDSLARVILASAASLDLSPLTPAPAQFVRVSLPKPHCSFAMQPQPSGFWMMAVFRRSTSPTHFSAPALFPSLGQSMPKPVSATKQRQC